MVSVTSRGQTDIGLAPGSDTHHRPKRMFGDASARFTACVCLRFTACVYSKHGCCKPGASISEHSLRSMVSVTSRGQTDISDLPWEGDLAIDRRECSEMLAPGLQLAF